MTEKVDISWLGMMAACLLPRLWRFLAHFTRSERHCGTRTLARHSVRHLNDPSSSDKIMRMVPESASVSASGPNHSVLTRNNDCTYFGIHGRNNNIDTSALWPRPKEVVDYQIVTLPPNQLPWAIYWLPGSVLAICHIDGMRFCQSWESLNKAFFPHYFKISERNRHFISIFHHVCISSSPGQQGQTRVFFISGVFRGTFVVLQVKGYEHGGTENWPQTPLHITILSICICTDNESANKKNPIGSRDHFLTFDLCITRRSMRKCAQVQCHSESVILWITKEKDTINPTWDWTCIHWRSR